MPLTLISVLGTCAQHVLRAQAQAAACPCQCLHVLHLSAWQVYNSLWYVFIIVRIVCKILCATCLNARTRHVVVDWGKVLSLSETNCSLPHVLARCHIPPSIPSQFAHSPVLPHFCHFVTKTWIPRLHLMQCFQVAKEPKEAVVADGFSRLGPIVTERNKNEKHQKVRCNLQSPSACVL